MTVHLSQMPVGPLALLAGSLCLGGFLGAACAAPAPPDAPVPTLQVRPLADDGGLPVEAGKAPLNVQFAQGLAKSLADQAKGRYVVTAIGGPVAATDAAGDEGETAHRRRRRAAPDSADSPQYTLEGDLSHVQTGGDTADAGPYFCALRLYRNGTTTQAHRRLVHQWMGMARTYLDLTSNLSHDPRVDVEGLQGDLAGRVIADVTAAAPADDSRAAFAALVASAAALKRVTAEVVPESGAAVPGPHPSPLRAGDRYRLRVSSQDRGSVYLVSLDDDARPTGLFVPDAGQEVDVDAGRPALIPPQDPLETGDVTGPTDRTLVILVRRPSAALTAPRPSAARSGSAPVHLAGFVLDAAGPRAADDPAVQILDSGTLAPAPNVPSDTGVAQILKLAAADPAGTWLAQTVTVHIVPRPAGGAKQTDEIVNPR